MGRYIDGTVWLYAAGGVEISRCQFGSHREAARAFRRWADELDPLPAVPPPPAARTGDPDTSQASAGSRGLRLEQVKPGHRSYKVLAQFGNPDVRGLTDNTAARWAAGSQQTIETLKAYARICTELRRLGLIERTGHVVNGAMICRITESGRAVLHPNPGALIGGIG
jgi:hypothetical protein